MNKKIGKERSHKQPQFRLKPACAAVLLAFTIQTTQANPIGPSVVNGQASFATTGNALTVTNTPGAIINWQGFSIGANEITRFAQQSASSAVLNRVISNNPSSILGTLQSNGRVFLINPSGIVFGRSATVDVAGMVASTLNLSNADFLAGRYNFTQVPGAANISNAGNLTAQTGGQIFLIAPNVENTGVITAPNGEILLAAGHSVDLVDTTNPNLRVNITAPAGDATNVGQLVASAGNLGLFGTVVRNSGKVSADSAVMQGGKIVFKASQRVEAGGTISAQGTGGGEIKVLADMQSGTVNVTGTLDASSLAVRPELVEGSVRTVGGGDGGFIETSAAHVQVANTARITTAAPNGKSGTWLIDPQDFTIAASGGDITGAALSTALDSGSVTIQSISGAVIGNGDIFVSDSITKTATGVGTNTLTLQAESSIIVAPAIAISSTGDALNVIFNADSAGSGSGAIVMNSGSSITSNGGNITLGGGSARDGFGAPTGNAVGNANYVDGILLDGASINAGGGNISLRGTGAAGTGSSWNLGLYVHNGATVITTGAGTITLDGTGGAGGTTDNYGIRLGSNSLITSENGPISITGQGGAGTGAWNYGVVMGSGAAVTSTGAATITLNGTAGAGTDTNRGVYINGTGTTVTSVDGDISITGQGAGSSFDNRGIYISGGAKVTSTGAANITLDGTGSAAGTDYNYGVYIKNTGTAVSASNGAVSITGHGAGSGTDNYGVWVTDFAKVASAGAGAITLGGFGGASTGSYNTGVYVSSSAMISATGAGGITLNGTGGSSGIAGFSNRGVRVSSGASITTNSGNIGITGTGAYDGDGVQVAGTNTKVQSTSGGSINITGTSGTGPSWESGIFIGEDSSALIQSAGDITLTGISLANADGNNYGIDLDWGSINSTGGNLTMTGTSPAGATNYGINIWDSINSAGTTTLNSDRNILIQTSQNPTGNMVLRADMNGTGTGTVVFSPVITITSLAGKRTDLYYNPAVDYATPDDYSANLLGAGTSTAWMLVNDLAHLQGLGANLYGNYALGIDIDAMGGSTSPIGFMGRFDGQNHTITGLTSSLFGSIIPDGGGIVSNVGLINSTVTTCGFDCGALAGTNYGTINNSYAINPTLSGATSNVGGLVGSNYGTISNSYVSGGTISAGSGFVGGLVGWNSASGTITNSHVIGAAVSSTGASGSGNVGGLAGQSSGTISNSYVSGGSVNGTRGVGGLVGSNSGSGSIISNSYVSGGSVNGSGTVGGLAGHNSGTISNSYVSGGSVNSAATDSGWVGGLVGDNLGTISTSYASTGVISSNPFGGFGSSGFWGFGGLVGKNAGGIITDSFWDVDTSGQTTGIGAGTIVGATGIYSSTLTVNAFTQATYTGFDFTSGTRVWWMSDGNTRPFLQSEYSTTITNAHQLQLMAMNLGASYTLANNLDLAPALDNSITIGMWSSKGFAPVGDGTTHFTGQFDGLGHTISNLTVNRPTENYVGLFGYADGTSISNVVLANANVTGDLNVGALAGANDGFSGNSSISNSSISGGTVTGNGIGAVGGLVGLNWYGGISNSHVSGVIVSNLGSIYSGSTTVGGLVGFSIGAISNSDVSGGSVTGTWGVGGLVGNSGSSISGSHVSNVIVTGDMNVGGLVGYNSSTISNSYVDNSVSGSVIGTSEVGGLVGSNGGTISNSYVSGGSVTGSMKVGGLVGYNRNIIDSSSVSGGTIVSGSNDIGGLVGWNGGTIGNSSVSDGAVSGGSHVGGLAGYNGPTTDTYTSHAQISASYVTGGSVSGSSSVGGLVGFNDAGHSGSSAISNSYVSGVMVSGGTSSGSGANQIGGLVGNNSGSISNSYVSGGSVTAYGSYANKIGGLVGNNSGTISNSYVSGDMVVSATNSGRAMGGLVGENSGTISNSYVSGGTVNGSGYYVGGLVGRNDYGTVSNSHVINTYVTGTRSVGGLVGRNDGTISNSYVSGGFVTGTSYNVGGLVGKNTSAATFEGICLSGCISNSYVSGGMVTGTHSVGGLVGTNYGSIVNSYVSGGTVVSGHASVGGLVGYNGGGTISNSYVSGGMVSGTRSRVGGLVGYNSGGISNSYVSGGSVTGTSDVGGLVGNGGTVTNSHYSIDGTPINTGNLVTLGGLYDAQYQDWLTHSLTLDIANYASLALAGINSYTITTVQGMKDLLGFADIADYTFSLGSNVTLTPGLYIPYLAADFNGAGFTLSDLVINQPNGNLGMFGVVAASGTVSNLGLINSSVVAGGSGAGGLAGLNEGSISNSYVSGGTVSGSSRSVGGLVGSNNGGTITNSYVSGVNVVSTATWWGSGTLVGVGGLAGDNSGGSISSSYVSGGTVSGVNVVGAGGLAGINEYSGTISNSYVSGVAVSGRDSVGGLVGHNRGAISNNYVSGATVSGSNVVGGLVGYNATASTSYGVCLSGGCISNSYVSGGTVTSTVGTNTVAGGLVGRNYGSISNTYASSGSVSSSNGNTGGVVGDNFGSITNSFWDTQTTGQTSACWTCSGTLTNVLGLTTADFFVNANFTSATPANGYVNPAWDFTNTWWMSDTNTRPFLRMEHSTTITNAHQLQLMAMDLGASYTLANNLDLGPALAAGGMWDATKGFVPVGHYTYPDYSPFTGQFDGQYFTISNLTINRPGESYVGLFGYSVGTLSNIGLLNATVSGGWSVGALAGNSGGGITNSYVDNSVSGSVSGNSNVGGLVGYNGGTISDSHVIGSSSYVPGVSVATVSGSSRVGGLVGSNGDTISNSWADSGHVTGVNNVGGLVGRNNYGTIDGSSVINNSTVEGSSSVGGLVGYGYWDIITNSFVDSAMVTGTGNDVGGLVGYDSGEGAITGNHVINSAVSGGWSVGGLVGVLLGTGGTGVTNSYVDGGSVSGNGRVGGLVGHNFNNISYSHVSGVRVDSIDYVGGLVGLNEGTISNSYVTNRTVNGINGVAGGLAGYNSGTISNSHVSGGSVTGSSSIGGLVGWNSGGAISNSYVSSGYVYGYSNVGGLVGNNSGTLTNSHYNVNGVAIQDGTYVTLGGLYNDVLNVNGVGQYDDWFNGGLLTPLSIANYSSLSGSGVSYTISTIAGMKDLLGFADNPVAYSFTLANNITLPSGYNVPYLSGNFDGGGFTLSGLNINLPNSTLGLFNHVAAVSTVNNVVLDASAVTGRDTVGALAGLNEGTISNSYVSNSNVTGTTNVGGLVGYSYYGGIDTSYVSGGSVTGTSYVGGLVGYSYYGSINASYATASVNGDSYVGGLAGRMFSGAINFSHATGIVTGTGSYVGGLVGSAEWAFGIYDSYATGNVTSTLGDYVGGLVGNANRASDTIARSYATGDVTGASYVGGLVGYNWDVNIDSTYATGNVTGTGDNVGGLVGWNGGSSYYAGGSISNSYATGNVSGSNNIGGLVGRNSGDIIAGVTYGSISNSYATGNVSGSDNIGGLVGHNSGAISNTYASGGTVTGSSKVGGLVGYNNTTGSDSPASISNSYVSGGTVSGSSNVGGLVGYNHYSSVSNSFWDTALVGGSLTNGIGYNAATSLPSDAGAAPLTLTQMMTRSNFVAAGWNIANTGVAGMIWRIYEGNTTPLLTYFLTPLTATANAAIKTSYDGLAYSGGNGVTYSDISAVPGVNVFEGSLAYGGNSQGAINAGSYTITPLGLYSNQQGYDIIYADGTLTVNPATVSLVGTRAYDATLNFGPVAFGTFATGVGAENLVVTGTGTVASKDVSAGVQTLALGSLALGNGTGLASNYVIAGAGNTGEVTAAALTVAANAISKNAGDADPLLSYMVAGLRSPDTEAATYTVSGSLHRAPGESVGSYAIDQGSLAWTLLSTNYTMSYAPNNFSIITKPLITAGTMAGLMNMILVPGGGASGSSQSTIGSGNKKPPPPVVVVDDKILPADSNAPPLPVCPGG